MSVVRRRKAVTTVRQDGEVKVDYSRWLEVMYSHLLNNWDRSSILLNAPTDFKLRREIKADIGKQLPHLGRKDTYSFEQTYIEPLKKIGLLDAELGLKENRYALSKHGRELAVPIVGYALTWMHDNSERCLREVLGVSTQLPKSSFIRAKLIESIDALCVDQELSRVDISAHEMLGLMEGVLKHSSSEHSKKELIRKHFIKLKEAGLVIHDSIDRDEPLKTYMWMENAPHYYNIDSIPRKESDAIVLYLFENRGIELSGDQIVKGVEEHSIFPRGKIYKVVEKLVEYGCLSVVRDRKARTLITPTKELLTYASLFRDIEEVVKAYFTGEPSEKYEEMKRAGQIFRLTYLRNEDRAKIVLTEMKRAGQMFRSTYLRNEEIAKQVLTEMKQRYDRVIAK
jgi:predicted DNA binding protein